MRDSRVLISALAAFLLTILIAPAACLADDPVTIWPTFHMNNSRTGQNTRSTDIDNPASLNLIWAFPRNSGSTVDDETSTIVDDDNTDYARINPSWKATLSSDEAYGVGCRWMPAISKTAVNPTTPVTAKWQFPHAKLDPGIYQVMVWVPSKYENNYDTDGNLLHHNTTKAQYKVYDDTGMTTVTFDQTDGGYWRLLTTKSFSFSGTDTEYYVELSNQTEDTETYIASDNTIVVADAIKFVPGTGMEIYSSPASATIPWQVHWTYPGDTDKGYSAAEGDFSGNINVVYTGTVESFLGKNSDSPDMGAIYCVNSITPTNVALDDATAMGTSTWKKNWGLSQYLGTSVWRYPRAPQARHDGSDVAGTLVPANDIEGPIEGGVYSSPVIAPVLDPVTNKTKFVCVVAASDRQVYALDATTGELLWKGPGVTVGEKAVGWTEEVRREAFGGAFHWVQCVADAGDTGYRTATWLFDTAARQAGGEPTGGGWSYAIYAWMPPRGAGDPARTRAAKYTITYQSADGSATTDVTVDQGDSSNQGRWVKLGSSYFNVSSVSVDNLATALATGKTAADYSVVADAVMIVPETIEGFTYSSPAVDIEGPFNPSDGSTPIAHRVFAASASGRAVALNLVSGRVEWIYPKVRTTAIISGAADADAAGLGEIGASPSYENADGGTLYISSLSGTVYAIQGVTTSNSPSQKWAFPDANDTETPDGFTSSPTLDTSTDQIFIGSTGGVFYCLDRATGNARWQYPASGSSTLPLGAFRYSTAAVADDYQGMHRAWIASTDGHIYSFAASRTILDPDNRRLWVEYDDSGNSTEHGTWYNEPNTLSTIQASVALDGRSTGKRTMMYVGDMQDKGVFRWFDATNGTSNFTYDETGEVYKGWTCEGQLFSSPNATHVSIAGVNDVSYLYQGGSDGRIYAFSPDGGAWGGRWAGGDWPFAGNANDRSQMERYLSAEEDVQFDIFPAKFYNNSSSKNPEVKDTSGDYQVVGCDTSDVLDDQWILSKEMKMPTDTTIKGDDDKIKTELRKQAKERRNWVEYLSNRTKASSDSNSAVYLEWGETLYLVLWNLPDLETLYPQGKDAGPKRSNLRFNLVNQSSGSSSGSQIRMAANCRILKEYTVLDKTDEDTATDPPTAPALKWEDGTDVKRCYALAAIEIRGTGSRPPSPGPGWVLTVEVRQNVGSGSSASVTQMTIPLAKLKTGGPSGAPDIVLTPIKASSGGATTGYDYKPQLLGINNPLAIRDDADRVGHSAQSLSWPSKYVVDEYTRADSSAHFNGNATLTWDSGSSTASYDNSIIPTLNLNIYDSTASGNQRGVPHGTSSREGWLGVMDRSATGITPIAGTNPQKWTTLDRFRIAAGDLGWRGGTQAISNSGGTAFPWELGVGSIDYPNIYERSQDYRKKSDDANPSKVASTLPSIVPADSANPRYEDSLMRPDTVFSVVEVPRFQPANENPTNPNSTSTGYSRVMEAFIDSDGDQHWDSGDSVYGRPTTYQEAYRKFRVRLSVPPDPRIEVDEQLIDVGQAPHGLGEGFDFVPYNRHPDIQRWFKNVTIRNAGNVNLYDVRIWKGSPLFRVGSSVTSNQSDWAVPQIPGFQIRSSIDTEYPDDPLLAGLKTPPFITAADSQGIDYNYTVTKARVGDPDPTILTIPDRRKWQADYPTGGVYTQDAAKQMLMAAGWTEKQAGDALPLSTEVSVAVPLSQQIGTYVLPFVGVRGVYGGKTNANVAVADPTFGLKVTVEENRMTGGSSPGVLPQIPDEESTSDSPLPKFGDATPAAYRDPVTGRVHLFFSSNRMDPALIPDDHAFAGAPWLIYESTLDWNTKDNGWAMPTDSNGATLRWWWQWPGGNRFVPNFTESSPATQWPTLLAAASGAKVMKWTERADAALQSVSHSSPVVAINWDAVANEPDADTGKAYLAWVGVANVLNADNKVTQEYRVFYTDVTGGDVSKSGVNVYSIEHEPGMDKRYPSLEAFLQSPSGGSDMVDRLWMFWQGGESGRWSIYYAVNSDGPVHPSGAWSAETRLRTPDCLASLSSPSVMHRDFWSDLGTSSSTSGRKKDMLDVVYSGISKLSQNPDIMMSRYAAVAPGDSRSVDGANVYSAAEPGRTAQPLPRVYGEKLQRDAKYGYFTSKHLAWMRLGRQGYENIKRFATATADLDLLLQDHVGRAGHLTYESNLDSFFGGLSADRSALVNTTQYNVPYIWVELPEGYGGDSSIAAGTIVSATAGVIPEFDDATGVCTYKYPEGSLAAKVLGQTLVDFSAGIIRFTKPLSEIKNLVDGEPDGTVKVPKVFADYTPLTWRLTTDQGVDNSSRAFVEHTPMTQQANPGLSADWVGSQNLSTDRIWALWRRAGTAVNSSTIYWKTYRVGIDLSQLTDSSGNALPPIQINWKSRTESDGAVTRYIVTDDVTVNGALGPWEVDSTGTRIYFSGVDERYTSLIKSGSIGTRATGFKGFLTEPAPSGNVARYNSGTGFWEPKPITVEYTGADGETHTATAYDVSLIEESPEQSLFGYVGDSSVNEGSVYAFADPNPMFRTSSGTWTTLQASKIWVFWTSTRAGKSDLCWATLTPNFGPR